MSLRVGALMEPAIEVSTHATVADIEAHVHAGAGRYLRAGEQWETFLPWLLVGIPRTRRLIDVPRARCATVDPEADAFATLQALELSESDRAPVVRESRLLGQVTREQLRREIGQTDADDAALAELATLRTGMAALLHDMGNTLLIAQAEVGLGPDQAAARAEALDHAAQLLHAGRSLLRGDLPTPVLVDMASSVRSALPLLRAVARNGVTVEVDVVSTATIRVSSGFMPRLLVNLIKNSREALADGTGSVWIRVAREGDEAVLTVSDDGPGISPGTLARILAPGFSTKGSPESRGMGLAGLRALVQRWGGRFGIESMPGRGATVSVRLPVASGAKP